MKRLPLVLVLGWALAVFAGPEHVWDIRVLDPEGRPVPRARLWLFEKGPSYHSEQWRYVENGLYEHRSQHGDSHVWIEVMGATDAEGRPLPLGAAIAGPLGPGDIVVRLAAEKEIRGFVRTADGKPVSGATVHAIRYAEDAPAYHDEAVSDASGTFRLGHLGAFRYRLVTEPPAGFLTPEPVAVESGATDALVSLRAMVAPRLIVRGPDGKLLPGCRIRLERPDADDAVRTTDATGTVVLPPVDPARPHPLHIEPLIAEALPIFDATWLPRSTTIVLERACTIAGVVRGPDGAPIPDASVWVRTVPGAKKLLPADWAWLRLEDGSMQGALTDQAGCFEIRRLHRSDYLLFAALPLDDGKILRGAARRVSAGARDVVLELPGR